MAPRGVGRRDPVETRPSLGDLAAWELLDVDVMGNGESFVGRTFGGRYLSTAVLGEGGMAEVLRGVPVGGGREVAIKTLLPALAHDPVYRARFEQEARMAAQIEHPSAVRVLDFSMDEAIPYLVMELVEGRDLCDVLAKEGRLDPARAVAIAIQICDVVATAHDRGIIHRDLKPENVMLVGDPDGAEGERVKLLDFGVAKQLGSPHANITVSGTIIGTPAYMSPEQAQGGTVDARSDVYACGALLYHLVTGRPPFDDERAVKVLYAHVHEAPLRPGALVPGLDPELEASVLKALAKHPDDRQQGVHELWEDLLAMLPRLAKHHPEVLSRMVSPKVLRPTRVLLQPVPPSPQPSLRRHAPAPRYGAWARRAVPMAVGLAAAAGLVIGLVGWVYEPISAHDAPDPSHQSSAVSLRP